MTHRRSPVALDLPALEAARQRRAETAAELRALLAEEAASEARGRPGAPSSPGILTEAARRMIARGHEARLASSPCPDIERRLRDIASVEAWEVEPESGPVSLRPGVVALGLWGPQK